MPPHDRRSWLARTWHALTRERALPGRRAARSGRRSRSGVALLLTVSIVALMTVVVTEVVHTASVRIRMSANARDEAMAEALAQGGLGFYRLFLVLSRSLENNPMIVQVADLLGLNANDLWQVLPSISTGMMRMLVLSGGDEEQAAAMAAEGGIPQEKLDEGRVQTSLRKAFLDFPGDFTAQVVDEDSRVWVGSLSGASLADMQQNSPQANLLHGLMATDEEQDFLRDHEIDDPWELIGNLADWTDPDDLRIYGGGRESALYERLDEPYPVKNASFDSFAEIRLVDGWHRDAIWERYGDKLTIYGKGKLNINTASDAVLASLFRSVLSPLPSDDALQRMITDLRKWMNMSVFEGGVRFRKPNDFVQFLEAGSPNGATVTVPGTLDSNRLRKAIKTNSRLFRVTSRGQVGEAIVELEAIFDFNGSRRGKVLSWRIK